MPRYSNKLYHPTRQQADRFSIHGLNGFIDPFPLGFGTLPEKILYWALSERNIPFYYLNDIRFQFPEINFDKTFQADFILPTLNIIIEVNGSYWHSMAKTIDEDAFKYAIYQQAGYKILPWWDFDIINDVNLLFLADPQLAKFNVIQNKSSELNPMARTKTDTSKGIRTLNKKRGARLSYRKRPISLKPIKKRKVYATYRSTTR